MKMTTARTALFGPYTLDLRSGELRKFGTRVKIGEQTFQIILMLLETPGELVTREDLRAKLWADDTFVDFDHGLNSAVQRLRDCLSDSAEKPRWVETVPRRGYRFIGHVEWSNGSPPSEMLTNPSSENLHRTSDGECLASVAKTAPRHGYGFMASVIGADQVRKRPARSRRFVVGAAATVVAVAIAGGLIWRMQPAKHLTAKDTIVLGEFANSTGDAIFDGTLREGLAAELQQSPFLSLVSDQGMHESLQMMGKSANAQLTPEITREVCIRTGSVVAVEGSIALIGRRYNLILKAIDCASGDSFASSEAQASDKSHVLDALGNAASAIRGKLGESVGSLQKYNTPLTQTTTPSLEALQAYNMGLSARGSGDDLAAVAFLERATQIDPNFAMAYDLMGVAHGDIGETALSAEEIAKAFGLRAGVGEREKLLIEADFHILNTGDLIKVRRICELGLRIYPREVGFRILLGAISYSLGQYENGISEDREVLRLIPNSSYEYRQLLLGHLSLNRIEGAEAIGREAHEKSLDSNLAAVLYATAFYRDDAAEMARQAARATGVLGEEDLLLAMEADTAAFTGHLAEARRLSRRAADSAERAMRKETAAGYYAVAALREALFGDAVRARQETAAAAKLRSSGRDVEYGLALTLAYAGKEGQARALSDDLEMRFPEDTVVHFNYVPVIRAKLALLRSNSQEALDDVAVAVPYELGLPSFSFYNWPNLYPAYVQGEAYLAANKGKEAAAVFQKILTHRGLVLNEPIGALAHLGMARAYALDGDTANSRAAYKDFLALWKDADLDIPILKEAKAEYARLQQ
jgi:DNA-binding winged helix-turn-helix (wHTH) protein